MVPDFSAVLNDVFGRSWLRR